MLNYVIKDWYDITLIKISETNNSLNIKYTVCGLNQAMVLIQLYKHKTFAICLAIYTLV